MVQANLAAAAAPDASGRTFNVAMGETRTINDLVTAMNELLGTDLQPQYLPPHVSDVSMSQADISLAAELLGYVPAVTVEAGLERTVAWMSGRLALPARQ